MYFYFTSDYYSEGNVSKLKIVDLVVYYKLKTLE